jgi:hypothetical protein
MARTRLCELSLDALSEDSRVIVVGDIHGDYESFQGICNVFNPVDDCLVFLGDYADRGLSGVEVIEGVIDLREKYPSQVITLKGNHEAYTEDGRPTFTPCDLIREVGEKRGGWGTYFLDKLKPFFDTLYVAALALNEVLFVHGGISRRVKDIDDLRFPSQHVENDVLWSDPLEGESERVNRRGAGVAFGTDVSEEVCRSLGVDRLVRSHQPKKACDGPRVEHAGRVVTISSTVVYGGKPFVLALPIKDLDAAFTHLERHTVYLQ